MGGLKKPLIWLHKWLGVVLALFSLMWFASGVVLYYVPYPALTSAERLAALAPLALPPGCCLSAQQAAAQAGLPAPTQARLGMLGAQPVWRLATPGHWHTLDARSAQVLAPRDAAQAQQIAAAFAGREALAVEQIERDQWSVPQGLDPHRPLFKVRMAGGDGLELYVSPVAAEVVRDTRRAERFWNWLGAVPHWLYPTVLRQFPQAWHQVVVWLSIPAVLLAATGLVLGLWQLFLNCSRWIPYRKRWLRWHHIVGLVAGVCTLTWMFSGLLSMNPFGVFGGGGPAASLRPAWEGAMPALVRGPEQAVQAVQAEGLQALEVDLLRIAGQAWWRVRTRTAGADLGQRLLRADQPGGSLQDAVPEATVQAALAALRPQAGAPALERLAAYDDLYYSRHGSGALGQRPLPVWRAQWADGVHAYADPASAAIVQQGDARSSYRRWLYHGLHSLDFAPLLARPLLRSTLVVGLSLWGLALCLTSCVLAWRVLRPVRKYPVRGDNRA